MTEVHPELTLGLPAMLTAATGMDAIAHCMEWTSPVVKTLELLKADAIGEIMSATINFSGNSPPVPGGAWRQDDVVLIGLPTGVTALEAHVNRLGDPLGTGRVEGPGHGLGDAWRP